METFGILESSDGDRKSLFPFGVHFTLFRQDSVLLLVALHIRWQNVCTIYAFLKPCKAWLSKFTAEQKGEINLLNVRLLSHTFLV